VQRAGDAATPRTISIRVSALSALHERADKGWRPAPALFIANFLRQTTASALFNRSLPVTRTAMWQVLSRRCVQNVTLSPLRRH
jgi:hypothetical protein